jgi:glycosyltransferase involved in cell wall biosynthesis
MREGTAARGMPAGDSWGRAGAPISSLPVGLDLPTPDTALRSRVQGDALPRVAYLAGLDPSRKFGSLEEQILVLARAFRERGGCFVPIFVRPLGGEAAREYAAAGAVAESLDLNRFSPARLRALIGLLQRHQIDVAHWAFYHPFGPYVWALSLAKPGLRHFLTDHNSRYPDAGAAPGRARAAAKSALFARYERVVCVSDFVAASLEREGVRARLTACAHFANTERFRPDPGAREVVRRELGADGKFVALLVAYLIPEKGADVLLRALGKLPPDAVAWLVGDGPEALRLRELARELGIEERVRFLGDRGKVQPFMQAADCLVCPSLWDEAAGLVNLEGLACGLPIVASRVGGIPEIVDDGLTGFLFARGDAGELAGALAKLRADAELCARMGREARRVALERYAPERRLPDFLALYRATR